MHGTTTRRLKAACATLPELLKVGLSFSPPMVPNLVKRQASPMARRKAQFIVSFALQKARST
jgi:hypothetical protein